MSSEKTDNRQKAILVGVGLKTEGLKVLQSNLVELKELATTAGWNVVEVLTQLVSKWSPPTLIGSGKVKELEDMIREYDVHLVVIDHSLNGVQTRNLEQLLKPVRVLDRNQVIIEIFAQRARSYEGKLQVELAKLLDQLPRQVGAWLGSLSRQGAGIGTKGIGEKAIELDRRQIRKRMTYIKKKLENVRKNRKQHRQFRKKNKIPSFALIGYTNSGKSTLMKALTQSEVYIENQLFATLDPITRKVFLGEDMAVLTDTVGFIRKLPHHLIEAFKATFEELTASDVLLHVIDLSSALMEKQIHVVDSLVMKLGWKDKPMIHVFNKADCVPIENRLQIKQNPRVLTSANTGEGLQELKIMMTRAIRHIEDEDPDKVPFNQIPFTEEQEEK